MGKEVKKKEAPLMTPIFRVSFPSLFEPSSFGEGDPKYSVQAIFEDNLEGQELSKMNALKKMAEKCAVEKFGKATFEKLRKLGKFKWPFRDGEEKEHLQGYGAGKTFMTLSTKLPPGVIGRNKEALQESDVYAGCYARATTRPYAFDNKSKGVAFGLNNIQKVGDGESFIQRTRADEDFDEVDDETFVDSYAAPFDKTVEDEDLF